MIAHLPGILNGPRTLERAWWKDPERMNESESSGVPPSLDDPEIRSELVKRVRAEIEAGVYDTPERWEKALDQLFDRLEGRG